MVHLRALVLLAFPQLRSGIVGRPAKGVQQLLPVEEIALFLKCEMMNDGCDDATTVGHSKESERDREAVGNNTGW